MTTLPPGRQSATIADITLFNEVRVGRRSVPASGESAGAPWRPQCRRAAAAA